MMFRFGVRLFFLLAISVGLSGCLEASFKLSPTSRLPIWFELPEEVPRDNVSVTMDYYTYPGKRVAIFKLFQNGKLFASKEVSGILRGTHPLQLKNPPPGFPRRYPSYEVVTVNGITDIVEHRRMESIFYMADDPTVWKEFGVEKSN
ncbi:hypothetical protein ACUUL3_14805 [Thiovibrio sp. JS02]